MVVTDSVDLFATKGVEYLLVLGFLLLLVVYWRLLNRVGPDLGQIYQRSWISSWFKLVPEALYHPGHAWVTRQGGSLVRVGIDDFAQKLLGEPDFISMPPIGSRLEQGRPGLKLAFGSKTIEVLSPLDGKVVMVNTELESSPGLINEDPYGRGWVMTVRPRDRGSLKKLLTGRPAAAWMESTVAALRDRIFRGMADASPARQGADLALVLPDGGVPVSGFVRHLSPEDWEEVAREFLLTK